MDEEKRALHLTPEFPPIVGGIGDYVSGLADGLGPLGWNVRVVTSIAAAAAQRSRLSISPALAFYDRRMLGIVAGEVRDFRPHVVHVHYQSSMYLGDPAVCLVPLALRRRGLHVPVVTTLHDMRRPQAAPMLIRRATFETLLYTSNHLIVSGDAELRGLARRPGIRARSTMLPIGSNITVHFMDPGRGRAVRAAAGVDASTFLLMYFGLVREGKGLDALLEAIALLRRKDRLVELLIAGDGAAFADYRDRLVALGRDLGLGDAVRFLGKVPESEVSELLQAADLGVLPMEGGASTGHTTVFAAMSHGLPLLTTRGPATSPLLSDGAVALVPAPPKAAALAVAIEGLMRRPEHRAAMAAKGRDLAARYSRSAIAGQVAAIYSGVQRKDPMG